MYQTTGYFEQNANSMSADVSEVDYQFATEPMTAVKLAEQQVNEEVLLSSFEQAVSDRMEAIGACANLVSEPLTHQPHTIGDVLVPLAGTRDSVPSNESLRQRGGAGIWSSLLSNPWQRGIILASLALLLLMSGFDLMGVLILHMR